MASSRPTLLTKNLPEHRAHVLDKQGHVCTLCGLRIDKGQEALDHDHITGYCRAVLHRNCNSLEGRILHYARRSGIHPKKFLEALVKYWSIDYSGNLVHPTHKTQDQKELNKKKRALRVRIRKAKLPATKERLRLQLKELK